MWYVDSNSTVLVLYYVEKYTSVRGSCHHAAEKCFPLRCSFESQTLRSASCSGALCQYYYIWLSVATQCLGFKVPSMFDLYSGLILKALERQALTKQRSSDTIELKQESLQWKEFKNPKWNFCHKQLLSSFSCSWNIDWSFIPKGVQNVKDQK